MTIRQTMVLIRSLLDDGHDFYNDINMIVNVVNEAQLRMIDYWVATNNERALRPLYRMAMYVRDRRNPITPNQPIETYEDLNGNPVRRKPLYVRNCLVSLNDLDSDIRNRFTLHANFLTPELFLNSEGNLTDYNNNGSFQQTSMPHSLSYTIEHGLNILNEWQDYLLFTYGDLLIDSTAIVGFVAIPFLFSETQPLEVADEYHYEVCTLAAEILNSNDVGERNRSKVAVAEFGQKLDIQMLGTTDGK